MVDGGDRGVYDCEYGMLMCSRVGRIMMAGGTENDAREIYPQCGT